MLVRDIMTSEVSAVDVEQTLREAVEALRAWRVGGAPVLKGSEVVGVISAADILEFQATTESVPAFREDLADWGEWAGPEAWEEGESPAQFFVDLWPNAGANVSERISAVEGPEWDFLGDHVVAEVMTAKLLSVGPEADVRDAARLMRDATAHRALVLEEGRLVGIVSASDVVRAVAEGTI